MKERNPDKEPSISEKTLELWQTLEEAEDLYLKDFPAKTPMVFAISKKVKVSINFACYKDCRDYGIGAISISKDEDYGEFRKDIVIRRTSAAPIESTVREYDLDASGNHLPGDKNYPYEIPDLSQPISYYEEVLDNAKNPSALYRGLEHEDLDEAIKYLDKITGLLIHRDYEQQKEA